MKLKIIKGIILGLAFSVLSTVPAFAYYGDGQPLYVPEYLDSYPGGTGNPNHYDPYTIKIGDRYTSPWRFYEDYGTKTMFWNGISYSTGRVTAKTSTTFVRYEGYTFKYEACNHNITGNNTEGYYHRNGAYPGTGRCANSDYHYAGFKNGIEGVGKIMEQRTGGYVYETMAVPLQAVQRRFSRLDSAMTSAIRGNGGTISFYSSPIINIFKNNVPSAKGVNNDGTANGGTLYYSYNVMNSAFGSTIAGVREDYDRKHNFVIPGGTTPQVKKVKINPVGHKAVYSAENPSLEDTSLRPIWVWLRPEDNEVKDPAIAADNRFSVSIDTWQDWGTIPWLKLKNSVHSNIANVPKWIPGSTFDVEPLRTYYGENNVLSSHLDYGTGLVDVTNMQITNNKHTYRQTDLARNSFREYPDLAKRGSMYKTTSGTFEMIHTGVGYGIGANTISFNAKNNLNSNGVTFDENRMMYTWTDGKAPVYLEKDLKITETYYKSIIQIDNVYDTSGSHSYEATPRKYGSGIDFSSSYIKVTNPSNNKSVNIPFNIAAQGNDPGNAEWKYYVLANDLNYYTDSRLINIGLNSYYGNIPVELHLVDNLLNEKITKYNIHKGNPNPLIHDFELKKWTYSNKVGNVNTKQKWVGPNQEISYYIDGSMQDPKMPNIYVGYGHNKQGGNTYTNLYYTDGREPCTPPFETFKDTIVQEYTTSNGSKGARYTGFNKINESGSIRDFTLSAQVGFYVGSNLNTADTFVRSREIGEKNGYSLHLDGKAPVITATKTGRNTISVNIVDGSRSGNTFTQSGFKDWSVVDKDTGKSLLYENVANTTGDTVYTYSKNINVTTSKNIRITAVDNVGNTAILDVANPVTEVDTTITVNDKVVIESSTITDIEGNRTPGDCSTVPPLANLNTDGVLHNGKRHLKVQGTANIRNPVPGFTPIIRMLGYGDEIPFNPSSPVIKQVTGVGFNNITYIPDTYNTPSGPAIKLDKSSTKAVLSWNAMEDPIKNYAFRLQTKVTNAEDFYNESCTGPSANIKFASGYKDFKYKIYKKDQPTQIMEEGRNTSRQVDVTEYPTGHYTIEATMYDKNDNPSGTGKLDFYWEGLVINKPFGISVGAVKDVDWEAVPYPFNYGEPSFDGIVGVPGTHRNYFPLGKVWKAEGNKMTQTGNKIAKGYTVNWDIGKKDMEKLSTITIKYKFKDTSGAYLDLYQDGKALSTIDTRDNMNFTQEVISKSRFDTANERIYLKHFLPVNFTAKRGNADYKGDVTVEVEIHSTMNGATGYVQKFELYTTEMDKTALDDVETDKQR